MAVAVGEPTLLFLTAFNFSSSKESRHILISCWVNEGLLENPVLNLGLHPKLSAPVNNPLTTEPQSD